MPVDLDHEPTVDELRQLALGATLRRESYHPPTARVMANATGWCHSWTAAAVYHYEASAYRPEHEAWLWFGVSTGPHTTDWFSALLARWPATTTLERPVSDNQDVRKR